MDAVQEFRLASEVIADPSLKKGDLIEFHRTFSVGKLEYGHWAVYTGTQAGMHYIVHKTNEDGNAGEERDVGSLSRWWNSLFAFSVASSAASSVITVQILKSNLGDMADRVCRINNSLDQRYTPRQSEDIAKEATSMIGSAKYNLLFANCEHFANYCRYGEAVSTQVQKALRLSQQKAEEKTE